MRRQARYVPMISVSKNTGAFSNAWSTCEAAANALTPVTVIEELQRHNQLESCDGLSYICSLDDAMPRLIKCHSYVGIVKEKALLRRTIFTVQQVMNRCFLQEGSSQEILAGAGDLLGPLGARCRAQADASRERRPGEIQISGGQCRRAAGLAFSFIRTGCSPAHLPFCLLALAWLNQKV